MYAKGWRRVRILRRKLGPLWLVKRQMRRGQLRGYFKFSTRRNSKRAGNVPANEYLAYRLAQRIGLPVAQLEWAKIKGKTGIVSEVYPVRRLYNWNQYIQRKGVAQAIDNLEDPGQLLQTFVFDIWICNVDRHGGNLIVYPSGDSYRLYLIDHGLTLSGALTWRRTPWPSPYWERVWSYKPRYVRGLLSYIHSYKQLKPYIRTIQRIPAREIREIVDSLPEPLLPTTEKILLKDMLLYRKKRLHRFIKQWFRDRKRHVSPSQTTRNT